MLDSTHTWKCVTKSHSRVFFLYSTLPRLLMIYRVALRFPWPIYNTIGIHGKNVEAESPILLIQGGKIEKLLKVSPIIGLYVASMWWEQPNKNITPSHFHFHRPPSLPYKPKSMEITSLFPVILQIHFRYHAAHLIILHYFRSETDHPTKCRDDEFDDCK